MNGRYEFEGIMKILHIAAEQSSQAGYQEVTHFINMATIALGTAYLEQDANMTTEVIIKALIAEREKSDYEKSNCEKTD